MLEQAIALHKRGQLSEAASLYLKILAHNPNDADALHLLGVTELQRGNASAAIEWFDRAIKIKPNNASFIGNRGLALQRLKRFDDALASFDRALAIEPDQFEALNNRGNALSSLNRFTDALASYDRALAIKPDHFEALYNRGNLLRELKHFDEALASYDRALAIKPNDVEALYNHAKLLRDLKRFDEALMSFDRALAIKPDFAEALNHRGNVLLELKRFEQALASYDRALAIRPDFIDALNNRGNVLRDLGRLDDALASYDRTLVIEPDHVNALNNRGIVLYELKRFADALLSFDRALAIKPDHPFLFGLRLFCKMRICDWRDLADDFAQLAAKIDRGENASPPFAVLATPSSAAQQRACSENFIRTRHPKNALPLQDEGRYRHGRIRLGYFSTDFHDHAVAQLISELFERHDRSKFELIAFSFGPPRRGAMRVRLEKSFDRFIEAGALSDRDIALLARRLEIDIAVDLNGFTQGGRTDVFAMRAAPIQVDYLGYPGTMGADYIDYLIADSTLIPEEQQQHYAEKIIYLPGSYQVNDSKRPVADRLFTRAECGLPEEAFVFCSFNNSYKFTPEMFGIWMRLLNKVEGSVLWLPKNNDAAMRNLRQEAKARGVDPERVMFAPYVSNSKDHLARTRIADLFLDTLPFNAHTTASDALWAGLPILTCLGKTFPGRVAASLLNAVGVPELITRNLNQYEALALELSTNPRKLLSIRQKLAANRMTHPLFDTALFAKHIESAYVSIWRRHQDGLGPEHIHVPPQGTLGARST